MSNYYDILPIFPCLGATFVCYMDSCHGKISEIARTKRSEPLFFRDKQKLSIFYQCDKCSRIYLAYCEDYMRRVDLRLQGYYGRLTAEEIKAEISKISGCFTDNDDFEIIARIRPHNIKIVENVRLVNNEGLIGLDPTLAGQKVKLTVMYITD